MALGEGEIAEARERAREREMSAPKAVAARYDRGRGRVVVALHGGLEIAFAPGDAQGLESARPEDLDEIEISPSGFGLHFPRLDADLYLPGLLEGLLGSKAWTAARMGKAGGSARSAAKREAARANGTRGGRPPKALPADG